MRSKYTKREKPPEVVPGTSPEQWQIIEYYSQHGAPKVKKVAKRFLRERG